MFNLNLDEVKTYDYHQVGLPSTIEGATYALEEFVAVGISLYFNGLHA